MNNIKLNLNKVKVFKLVRSRKHTKFQLNISKIMSARQKNRDSTIDQGLDGWTGTNNTFHSVTSVLKWRGGAVNLWLLQYSFKFLLKKNNFVLKILAQKGICHFNN